MFNTDDKLHTFSSKQAKKEDNYSASLSRVHTLYLFE